MAVDDFHFKRNVKLFKVILRWQYFGSSGLSSIKAQGFDCEIKRKTNCRADLSFIVLHVRFKFDGMRADQRWISHFK